MFKEYITDPIRINGGMDSLGRGLREYVKDKQYSPEIAGDEFGEMVMDVFSQVNTNISKRVEVEGAAPIPTNHPLSLCLKDRDFEYIVADGETQLVGFVFTCCSAMSTFCPRRLLGWAKHPSDFLGFERARR